MFTYSEINHDKLRKYVTIKESSRQLQRAFGKEKPPKEVEALCKYARDLRADYIETKQVKSDNYECKR